MAPTLLFLPDISGFTKFVNTTEVEHSRHIIAELLELIIDADELGLTVAEIEGDAVFFFRDGQLPDWDRIVAQARRMFEAFHSHLKAYGTHRICDCGACSTAEGLTLKIVVHAGPVQRIEVRGFQKPYGPDVIVAHRLLKNDVDDREYLLVTRQAVGDSIEAPAWAELHEGCSELDEVGSVPFRWMSLSPLLASIPEPPPPKSFERTATPWVTDIYVERDPDELFGLIMSLDLRLDWTPDVEELQFAPNRVNRLGTKHRCVVNGSLIDFETVEGDFGPGRRAYGEHVTSNPIVREHVNYFVVEAEGTGSRVHFEVHYLPRAFPLSLLAPLVRLRSRRFAPKLLAELKRVAEADANKRTGELAGV